MDNNVSVIFEGLNSEQKKAVACTEGPVLIVAGAGSGKTRVLTSRVANILASGCDASRVMALTFTRKAAGEMKERIARMVGERQSARLCMGTFHSVFVRFLREFAPSIGYPASFTIYDQSDSVSAVKACIKEMGLDEKLYKPKEVLSRISMAKNNLVTPAAYLANANIMMADSRAKKPRTGDIYTLYCQKCRQSGVMDFDDILLNINILLRDDAAVLESISSRFSYVLVDEYQDTNYAQYVILKRLCQGHRNICVVGDDSQSIYAFRGAKIENILNFRKDYPDCKTFRLERNYRSTQTIVNAANSLISKNERRIPKECYAVGEQGEKIRLLSSWSEQEEAILVTSALLSKMREDRARYEDFAILYRTNSQSRALEEALRKRNIPYIIYSGNSFFERAEVKDMMAYFKLVANPSDDESFKRAVNKPARGIGATSLEALSAFATSAQLPLFKAVYDSRIDSSGLKVSSLQKIRSFCDMILSLREKLSQTDAHSLAKRIADDSTLYAFYKSDTSIEGMSRTANIEELINSVASFVEDRNQEYLAELEATDGFVPGEEVELPLVRLDEYLENISLLSNVDVTDEEDTNNKVALMTVHSAKGLEFPYVFVTGLEENLFPSGGMLASPGDIEEERRLFYVAVTRAKKAVCLSFCQTRMRNGKHESNSPSRFIREIDPAYIENPLREEPASHDDSDDSFSFGGFSRFGTRSFYGRSSNVHYEKRQTPPARPASVSAPSPVMRPSTPPPPRYNDAEFVPAPMDAFKIGQRIEHNRFGPGTILDLSGKVPEVKAKISFDDYAEPKTILLKYAKMRIV